MHTRQGVVMLCSHGVKVRCGSFRLWILWINVWMAGETVWSLVKMCHTWVPPPIRNRYTDLQGGSAVWWPGTQSAQDNHVLACNFAKYSPVLKKNLLIDSAVNLNLVIHYSLAVWLFMNLLTVGYACLVTATTYNHILDNFKCIG